MYLTATSRLSFRLLTAEDAELFFELDQDPDVMRYLTGGKLTSRADIADIFIPSMEAYRNESKGWGLWGVFLSNNTEFIGWVLVRPMAFFSDKPEFDNLELGWRFKQSSWGKGFASEATQHIKEQLSEDSAINAFSATALADNLASISVMKNLGMSHIKNYRHHAEAGDVEAVYYQVINLH
ncbi:GNAT family N-acetyltransferase [Shewanella sp. VB17]|uniref:GNAT family N-acetyltransferase n=1 Tax=Shewanella sp. VB17 TaxID=2739432 RepID=UPI001565FB5B|nr:GNAT family N-acetyltransferase [Shewanella sp. VB17]NRD75585.1 GNAT family N-acetyltransferase [Shewanella sp. VB17]